MIFNYLQPDRALTPEEKTYVGKISDLLKRAKQYNRYDIIEEVNELKGITNKTALRNAYYRFASMEKNTPVNAPEPVKTSQPNPSIQNQQAPAQPKITPGDSNTIGYDPMLSSNPVTKDYVVGGNQNVNSGSEEVIEEAHIYSQGNAQPGPGPLPNGNSQQQQNAGGAVHPEEPQPNILDDGQSPGDVPSGEKERSSKMLAKVFVGAYSEWVPKIFEKLSTISDAKMVALQQSGQIDFAITVNIPMPEPHIMTMGAYLSGINKQASEIFNVSEETKSDLIEVTTQWLKTKNWGTTPGEMLAMMIGQHLISCSMTSIEFNKMIKANLESFRDITASEKAKGHTTSVSPDNIQPDNQTAESVEFVDAREV